MTNTAQAHEQSEEHRSYLGRRFRLIGNTLPFRCIHVAKLADDLVAVTGHSDDGRQTQARFVDVDWFMDTARFSLEKIAPSELQAADLVERMALMPSEPEAFVVTFYRTENFAKAERGELLFFPALRIGAMTMKEMATWTQASSAEDVAQRVLRGDIAEP